jgi:excinuclease ABC subunit B
VGIAAEDKEAYEKGEAGIIYKTIPQMEKEIAQVKKQMEKAARDLDFMEAARLRDKMFAMQKELEAAKV